MSKKLTILFENCEALDFTIDEIKHISLKNFNRHYEFMSGSVASHELDLNVVSDVHITLKKSSNKEYNPFNCEKLKTTVFDRVSNFNDITSIELTKEDGISELFYVPYDEGNNVGVVGATNINQHSYMDGDGNLHIIISENDEYINSVVEIHRLTEIPQPNLIPLGENCEDEIDYGD